MEPKKYKVRCPEELAAAVQALCNENSAIKDLRGWFVSGESIPPEYSVIYQRLQKLVGFPFPKELIHEFDAFLIPLARWAPETWHSHLKGWFYDPITLGIYEASYFKAGMQNIQRKIEERPWWKKLLHIYS